MNCVRISYLVLFGADSSRTLLSLYIHTVLSEQGRLPLVGYSWAGGEEESEGGVELAWASFSSRSFR